MPNWNENSMCGLLRRLAADANDPCLDAFLTRVVDTGIAYAERRYRKKPDRIMLYDHVVDAYLAHGAGWSSTAYASMIRSKVDVWFAHAAKPRMVVFIEDCPEALAIEDPNDLDWFDLVEKIEAVFDTGFSVRERDIVERHTMTDESLESIAESYGLTMERIRQIENKTIRRLRHPSRAKKLVDWARELG